jgi:hypothetical protein
MLKNAKWRYKQSTKQRNNKMSYKIDTSQFELPPEGLHKAVVFAWEDKGMQLTSYGEKHRSILKYESLTHTMKDGRRFSIFDFMNVAFAEKATLTLRYKQITGKALVGDTFDPNDLMGVVVEVFIVHNLGDNGRTYANIVKVTRCENQDSASYDLENEIVVVENPADDLPF